MYNSVIHLEIHMLLHFWGCNSKKINKSNLPPWQTFPIDYHIEIDQYYFLHSGCMSKKVTRVFLIPWKNFSEHDKIEAKYKKY